MPSINSDGTLPYSNDDTSYDAALSLKEQVVNQRLQVYGFIQDHNGSTCDEIEEALDIRHSSCSARIWEMNHRLSMIEDSGDRRATRSGKKAIVWKTI